MFISGAKFEAAASIFPKIFLVQYFTILVVNLITSPLSKIA